MNILIYDTETTGLVNTKLPFTDPSQPRLVQLAAALVDDSDWHPRAIMSFLITGVEVPLDAFNVHHISTSLCTACGVKLSYALHIFETLWSRAQEHWAYNADYDIAILSGELTRCDRQDFANRLPMTRCLMRPLTDVCRLSGKYGKYKWPKLAEAYKHFFAEPPAEAHDALADVQTTARVLRAFKEMQPSEPTPHHD